MRRSVFLFSLAVTAGALAHPARGGSPQTIPDSWLAANERSESRGDRWAVGDQGRSRGPHQIQRATWERYGGRRPWRVWAHDRREADRVARAVLADCAWTCRRRGRLASFANARYLYTHGGWEMRPDSEARRCKRLR